MGFFFQAADITGQILNFGLPAPLDLQVFGRSPKNLCHRLNRRTGTSC